MLIWIIIAIVGLSAGGYLAYTAGRASARRALPAAAGAEPGKLLERTIRDVRSGDILQQRGRDYLVEGLLRYDEDGHTWTQARAVEGGKEVWFLIGLSRGPSLSAALLGQVKLALAGHPGDNLEHEGVAYRLDKNGAATVTLDGDLGDLPGKSSRGTGSSQRCRWWRYAGPEGKCLVVEKWGDDFRSLAGADIPAEDVDLLGAS
jgi:hypothetical protein